MGRFQRRFLLAIALTAIDSTSWAQIVSRPDQPANQLVQVGCSLDAVGAWTVYGGGGLAFADVRVGVPFTRRFTFESYVTIPRKDYEGYMGLYGFQLKQRLLRASSATREIFLVYGGSGVYEHTPEREERYTTSTGRTQVYTVRSSTFVSPPLVPMVGGGVQQSLTERFSIRVDAQGLVWPYPLGVIARASVGVSVGLGRRTP
jgi:hypothetical protein